MVENRFERLMKGVFSLVVLGLIPAVLHAATVTVEKPRTHYPWNGNVDVKYTVTGVEDGSTYCVTAKAVIGTDEYPIAEASRIIATTDPSYPNYSFTWKAGDTAFRGRKDAKIVFTVAEPKYAVVDLSAGPYAGIGEYAVSYLHDLAAESITNDIYKTSKLLLKRVKGEGDKSIYAGAFEITQRQYELVTGESPSYFSLYWDGYHESLSPEQRLQIEWKRPVERVSYDALCGSEGFFKRLATRSKLNLSLPTAEEWIEAARGNMSSDKQYNLGSGKYYVYTSASASWLQFMGRYVDLWSNGNRTANGNNNPNEHSSEAKGTAIVGSYSANDNGLYDMHGNVAEWTRTTATNAMSEVKGILRGGHYSATAADCGIDSIIALDQSQNNYWTGARVFGDAGESFVHGETVVSAAFTLDVATDNVRYFKVYDNAGSYTFKYLINDSELDWVPFDEGNLDWRPEHHGANVATFATTGEKTTFYVWPLTVQYSAQNKSTTYNENLQTIVKPVVTAPAANYELVFWCADKSGQATEAEATETIPSFTNVKYDEFGQVAGYATNFKVTSPFYETKKDYRTLTINPVSIANATVNLGNSLVYTGNVQTQKIESVAVAGITYGLVKGRDYTVVGDSATMSGTHTMTLTGKGNFKDSTTKQWTIGKKALDATTEITFADGDLIYTGTEQTKIVAGVTVEVGGQRVAVEFDVKSGNKGTLSTAKRGSSYEIVIEGKGNFAGEWTKKWDILQRDIGTAEAATEVVLGNALVYNGDEQEQKVASVITAQGALDSAEYAVTDNKKTNASAKDGGYALTVTVTDATSNFKGSKTKDWTIAQKALEDTMFTLNPTTFVFNRDENKPTVTATDISPKSVEAITDSDWAVTYDKNIDVTDAAEANITAAANGNYQGQAQVKFAITPAVIDSVAIKPNFKSYVWNGAEKSVTRVMVVVKAGTLTLNGAGADPEYVLAGETKATASGRYTLSVTPRTLAGKTVPNFQNADPAASDTWMIVPAAPSVTWPGAQGEESFPGGDAGIRYFGVEDLTVAFNVKCDGDEIKYVFETESGNDPEVADNKMHIVERTVIKATAWKGDIEGQTTTITFVPGMCADVTIKVDPSAPGRVADDQFNRNKTPVLIERLNTFNCGTDPTDPLKPMPAWSKEQGKIYYTLFDVNEDPIPGFIDVDYATDGLKVSDDVIYVVAQIRDTEEKQYADGAVFTQKLERIIQPIVAPVINVTTNGQASRTVEITCAEPGNVAIYWTTNVALKAMPEAKRPTAPFELDHLVTNNWDVTAKYEGPFEIVLAKDEAIDIKAIAYLLHDDDVNDFKGRSAVTNLLDKREWCIGDALDCPEHDYQYGFSNGWSWVELGLPTVPPSMAHTNKPWMVMSDPEAVGGECMRSGALTNGNLLTSSLSTTVKGAGMIAFNWKAYCEDDPTGTTWDHGEFVLDGVVTQKIDGITGWQSVTNFVDSIGLDAERTHTLTWTYVKDFSKQGEGSIPEGEDCLMVDKFVWLPAPALDDLSKIKIKVDPLIYNMADQSPVKTDVTNYIHAVVKHAATGLDYELVEGEDYTVTVSKQKPAATYHDLVLTANPTSTNCQGTVTLDWAIQPLDISTAKYVLTTNLVYTGESQQQVLDHLYVEHPLAKLDLLTDPTVNHEVKDNEQTAAGSYELYVKPLDGNLNLKGAAPKCGWRILPKEMTAAMITPPEDITYNGFAQKKNPTIADIAPAVITENDYVLSWSEDTTNVGMVTVTVTPKGNYTNSTDTALTKTYQITPATIPDITLSGADGLVYDGSQKTVSLNTIVLTTTAGSYTLVGGTDYDVSGVNQATDAGTYTVTVTGKGNFAGSSKSKDWTIAKRSLSGASLASAVELTFNNAEQAPKKSNMTVKVGDLTLVDGDYSINVTSKKDAGDYTFTVTGTDGNFTGTSGNLSWKIEPFELADGMVAVTTPETWTGSAIEPEVTVTVTTPFSATLIKDMDFTVAADEQTKAGKHTVTVEGLNNYKTTSAIEKDWIIRPTPPTIDPHDQDDIASKLCLYGYAKVTMKAADSTWKIYYTKDESTPTTSSEEYVKPFKVSERTIVKAIAVSEDGEASSKVRSIEYRSDINHSPVAVLTDMTTGLLPVCDDSGLATTNFIGGAWVQVPTNFFNNGQVIAVTRGNIASDGTEIDKTIPETAVNPKWTTDVYKDGTIEVTVITTDDAGGEITNVYNSADYGVANFTNGVIVITNTATVISRVIGDQLFDSATVTNVFVRDYKKFYKPMVKLVKSDVECDDTDFEGIGQKVKVKRDSADPCSTYGKLYYTIDGVETEVDAAEVTFAISNSVAITAWVEDRVNNDYASSDTNSVSFTRKLLVTDKPTVTFGLTTDPVVEFSETTPAEVYTFSNLVQKIVLTPAAGNTKAFYVIDGVTNEYSEAVLVTNNVNMTIWAEAYADDESLNATSVVRTISVKRTPGVIGGVSCEIVKGASITEAKVTFPGLPAEAKIYWSTNATESPIGWSLDANGNKVEPKDYEFTDHEKTLPIGGGKMLTVKAIAYFEVKVGDSTNDWYAATAMLTDEYKRNWTIADAMGDPDRVFTQNTDNNDHKFRAVRVDNRWAVRSGTNVVDAIAGSTDNISTLSTKVTGWGTVSFDWKGDCEGDEWPDTTDYDRCECIVDKIVVASIDGDDDWASFSYTISFGKATDEHTIYWRYIKDFSTSEGNDCVYVDNFKWRPSGVPMPLTTVLAGGTVLKDALKQAFVSKAEVFETGTEAEIAAVLTQKRTDAGVVLPAGAKDYTRWECFVRGLGFSSGETLLAYKPIVNTTSCEVSITCGPTREYRSYTLYGAIDAIGPYRGLDKIERGDERYDSSELNGSGLDHTYDTPKTQEGTPFHYFFVLPELRIQ